MHHDQSTPAIQPAKQRAFQDRSGKWYIKKHGTIRRATAEESQQFDEAVKKALSEKNG